MKITVVPVVIEALGKALKIKNVKGGIRGIVETNSVTENRILRRMVGY